MYYERLGNFIYVPIPAFRKEQEQLKIPTDPASWTITNVMHWLRWAVNTFKSIAIDFKDWENVNGMRLCELTHEDFKEKVAVDPGDLFWTHLELLRKCKFVAVVQKNQQQLTADKRKYSIGPKGGTNCFHTLFFFFFQRNRRKQILL